MPDEFFQICFLLGLILATSCLTCVIALFILTRTEKLMSTNAQALADLQSIAQEIKDSVVAIQTTDSALESALEKLEAELAANAGGGASISATAVEDVVAILRGAKDSIGNVNTNIQTQTGKLTQDATNQAPPPPPVISVSMVPADVQVPQSGTQQFSATVLNDSSSKGVSYSVLAGGAGGTIDASGLYTAPAVAGKDTVVATSIADTTKMAQSNVTVV